ncbi:MAG: type III secretion system chaperone [Chlamydiota bacterium]|nr:type III secretion system chaperone [Chlamydiota bacterium]
MTSFSSIFAPNLSEVGLSFSRGLFLFCSFSVPFGGEQDRLKKGNSVMSSPLSIPEIADYLGVPCSAHAGHHEDTLIYLLAFGEIDIRALIDGEGMVLRGDIATFERLPDREAAFMLLGEANFLGQGTGGHTLAIEEERVILMTSFASRESPQEIKEGIESFLNYLEYWSKYWDKG